MPNSEALTEPLVCSIDRAAHLLGGVHRATIYRMIGRSEIASVPVGSRRMVTLESIHALVGQNASVEAA